MRFMENINLIEEEKETLRQECEFLKEQSSKEIDELGEECMDLNNQLADKDEVIAMKDEQLRDNERKIKLLTNELKVCLEAWEREKKELRNIRARESFASLGNDSEKSDQSENPKDLSSMKKVDKYQKLISEIDNRSRNLLAKSKKNIEESSEGA